MKFGRLFIPALAIFATASAQNAPLEPTRETGTERDLELHRGYDADSFSELEAAGEKIDFEDLDHELLAAAIFHETNRRRAKHDLPPLGYIPELRTAALIQARGMKSEQAISHLHPRESKETLGDRLDEVGLNPRFRAENVAMVFGIRYESGETIYPREENGERILSAEPEGPPIPLRTYLSFAENLLDNWMDSPGHRKNILHEGPESLGTACVHEPTDTGPDRFYCAQVFFAPMPDPASLATP